MCSSLCPLLTATPGAGEGPRGAPDSAGGSRNLPRVQGQGLSTSGPPWATMEPGEDPSLQTSLSSVAMGLGRSGVLRERVRYWDCGNESGASFSGLQRPASVLGFSKEAWHGGHGRAGWGLEAKLPGWLLCLDRDLAFPPASAETSPQDDAGGTGLALGRVPAGGHSSKDPLAAFSLGVLEVGWETGEHSRSRRAEPGAGLGCYSLGFLLGETISGAVGGVRFLG